MCGIVGLHTKTDALRDGLGAHLTSMLTAMTSRGPDSAGIALYADDLPDGWIRYSVRARGERTDWAALSRHLADELAREVRVEQRGDGVVLVASGAAGPVVAALRDADVAVVGHGRAMEVFKDVGAPRDICERFGVPSRAGHQGLGHTRMATESAVTTDHSHPFAVAADLCLVHNGSFSNYATVRRDLADLGIRCDTDNDSEVAARFVAHHLDTGLGLGDALRMVLKELDGFFTLLVASETEFAVMRDPFACKPAVLAETDDYVAMASEYHALANLPGIGDAEVFEPMPEEVHVWSR